jgi:nucleotide-binding universal stress UspA family protein
MSMRVIIWITEGTWHACVDAAKALVPDDADIVLVHVTRDDVSAVAHGAFTGLLGRRRPERDPGSKVDDLADRSANELLRAAIARLGLPVTSRELRGHIEHEVVALARDTDLLVLARDGDPHRQGPRSLGPASRFVVDHAPCPVLLVWPAGSSESP